MHCSLWFHNVKIFFCASDTSIKQTHFSIRVLLRSLKTLFCHICKYNDIVTFTALGTMYSVNTDARFISQLEPCSQ